MPIPAVVIGVIKVVGLAITAYELYELGTAAAKGIAEFEGSLEQAKEWVRKEMESIKDTLDKKIDKTAEIALLHGLEKGDLKRQSEKTKHPEKLGHGPTFGGSPEIIAAIRQAIPFRKEIGNVCELANKLPDIQLRRKDGAKLKAKDIPPSKAKALLQLLRVTAKEFGVMDEIEGVAIVCLKQLVVSRLFEFVDEMLDWASPLKAEACYGGASGFAEPKIESGTKLKRNGTTINPFWPTPQGRGSISADVTIPDYRKDALTKSNTFALIEIKFPGDRPGENQFKNYRDLSDACAAAKTGSTELSKTNGQTGVTLGCRIALFRYPEDVAVDPKQNNQPANQKGTPNKPSRSGRR